MMTPETVGEMFPISVGDNGDLIDSRGYVFAEGCCETWKLQEVVRRCSRECYLQEDDPPEDHDIQRLSCVCGKCYEALANECEIYMRDSERLAWFAQHSGMDGFGGIDLHDEAQTAASFFGRDEPNGDDYLSAIRTAIDTARNT
jgi:hypothetical protein